MEIKDDDYILGVWFSEGEHGNLIMTVKRGNEKDSWEGEYRFRWNRDSPFDEKDEKSFYSLKFNGKTEDEAIGYITSFFDKFIKDKNPISEKPFSDKYEYCEIKGGPKKFLDVLSLKPWAHIKREKK